MRVDLLGYLLGALDGPEQEKTRQRMEADPQLRAQLERLERELEPLEHLRWDHKPAVDLAQRTCQLVATHVEKTQVQTRRLEQAGLWDHVHRTGWKLVDVVVAAGIFLAASMMFFPAIANSRYLARLNTCQDNLRLFGAALPSWADSSSGDLPYIPADRKMGVAGFYAPQLLDAGYVTEHNRYVCPSSSLAKERNVFCVPTIASIQDADGEKLMILQRRMGGSYCYGLGHLENGKLRATRIRGRTYFPVMTDHAVALRIAGAVAAHGAQGINVLFEDGRVRFVVIRRVRSGDAPTFAGDLNSMFVSDRGLVEAGRQADDAVLGPSWARPIPDNVSGVDDSD